MLAYYIGRAPISSSSLVISQAQWKWLCGAGGGRKKACNPSTSRGSAGMGGERRLIMWLLWGRKVRVIEGWNIESWSRRVKWWWLGIGPEALCNCAL